MSKSSRPAVESSWPKLNPAPEVFNDESSESGGIMMGADTPGPRPGASFGVVGVGRRRGTSSLGCSEDFFFGVMQGGMPDNCGGRSRGGGENEENERNMGKGSANGGLATSSTGSALITELSPPQQ